MEVAKLARVPYGTFRTYSDETRRSVPTFQNAIAIARVLNVSPEWLWNDDQDGPPPRYVPPLPADLEGLFRPEVPFPWAEIAELVLQNRYERLTEWLRAMADLRRRLGNEGQAKALEEYLRLIQARWEAMGKMVTEFERQGPIIKATKDYTDAMEEFFSLSAEMVELARNTDLQEACGGPPPSLDPSLRMSISRLRLEALLGTASSSAPELPTPTEERTLPDAPGE